MLSDVSGTVDKTSSSFLAHGKIGISSSSQVAGSAPGWAPLCSGLGEATYTYVPLSPSSIIFDNLGDPFGWEINRGPGGK